MLAGVPGVVSSSAEQVDSPVQNQTLSKAEGPAFIFKTFGLSDRRMIPGLHKQKSHSEFHFLSFTAISW